MNELMAPVAAIRPRQNSNPFILQSEYHGWWLSGEVYM